MVYESLQRCADKEELKKYLDSDTVNGEIKNRYAEQVRDFKAGKFPASAWKGAPSSPAYCLYMMYEE